MILRCSLNIFFGKVLIHKADMHFRCWVYKPEEAAEPSQGQGCNMEWAWKDLIYFSWLGSSYWMFLSTFLCGVKGLFGFSTGWGSHILSHIGSHSISASGLHCWSGDSSQSTQAKDAFLELKKDIYDKLKVLLYLLYKTQAFDSVYSVQCGESFHAFKLIFTQNKVRDTVHTPWAIKNENFANPHVNTDVPKMQWSSISQRLLVWK